MDVEVPAQDRVLGRGLVGVAVEVVEEGLAVGGRTGWTVEGCEAEGDAVGR